LPGGGGGLKFARMNKHYPVWLAALSLSFAASLSAQTAPVRFPADKAANVNPDTHLVLTFATPPTLGNSGQIRIYDASNNKLVDTLDLSIPPGPVPGAATGVTATYQPTPYDYSSTVHATNANTKPGTPSGNAFPTPDTSQLTIIGGFTDGFHFYPVIIHGNTATIYPHNNLLDYNKTYYVQIDPGVLTTADNAFTGITGNTGWTFATKKSPPPADAPRLVVAGDGSGDFNTVQGAVDFIPDHNPRRVTIFIKNGTYEEIVYFRNKANITFLGEDRNKVLVCYPNKETFNPHPANVLTNEWPGTFPSRRAAFFADHSTGIQLINLSVETSEYGQAEGLLVAGGQNLLSHVNVVGSGDAIQLNDSVYLDHCTIVGAGDTILTRGPGFYDHCLIQSGGAMMWIRNTAASHGCVFVNSTFTPTREPGPTIARAPSNNGKGYPNAEVVLINCVLGNLDPALWGPIGGDTSNMHFWEYHSTNLSDGKPADTSARHAASKQLTMESDAKTIADYSNPTFVLGWTPSLAPIILNQPASASVAAGTTATFTATVAAVPAASYQWQFNGAPLKDSPGISGATTATLTLSNSQASNAGKYTLVATNGSGAITSSTVMLNIGATAKQ